MVKDCLTGLWIFLQHEEKISLSMIIECMRLSLFTRGQIARAVYLFISIVTLCAESTFAFALVLLNYTL